MGLREAFYYSLESIMQRVGGKKAECVEITGIKWTTFSQICDGTTQNPGLDRISKLIDKLTDSEFIEFIKKIRPELNIDVVNLEGKHEVLTYNIDDINVGLAGMPEHKTRDDLRHVLRNIPHVFKLQIPERFFPSEFSVRVMGHSMEPDIPHQAAVGLTMLKADRDFVAGEVYLCRLPYEGLVLRRVVVVPGQDALEFQALHSDRNAYRSQIMHPDEALPLIYARVRWVAFRK